MLFFEVSLGTIWGFFIYGTIKYGFYAFGFKIKEWENTRKRILWTIGWGFALLPTLIVYGIAVVVVPSIIRERSALSALVSAIVAAAYFGIIVCIYGAVKYPLKRKYGILEDYDIDRVKEKFENDPKYRAKWLAEQAKLQRQAEASQEFHPHGGGEGESSPSPKDIDQTNSNE